MDAEEKDKLERVLELSEDNNRMLSKLYRAMRWSRVLRIIYLIIIIGASLGIYYYIQPYLEALISTYGGIKEALFNIPKIGN